MYYWNNAPAPVDALVEGRLSFSQAIERAREQDQRSDRKKVMRTADLVKKSTIERPAWMSDPRLLPKRPPGR